LGDRIDLGKEGNFTFLFQVKDSPINSFHVPVVSSREESDEEFQVSFFTKLVGLGLMLGGLGFLSSSIVITGVLHSPLILLAVVGVLVLTYGGSNRNFGWVFIATGIAIAIATGLILLVPISLLSFLLATGAFSAGYQLFTAGKGF
jgi:hypothetical protein